MKDRLLALLGVESGEESVVTALLAQSVFLGIFFGAFDISAHSLFLSIFDEKMMAKAYVVSGLAGIILTSAYTWLQAKLKFSNFSIFNLFTVTLITLLLWVSLLMFRSNLVVFIVFIMLGPLNILAALGFWGTAGRLFTLRQGKRLFGLVDSGLIAGIIVSCYAIPLVLTMNFEAHNIILISAVSVLVASGIQIVIGRKFTFSAERSQPAVDKDEKKSVFSVITRDRYTTVMAVFVALSVMTAFFVQYSFMAVTREQYPAEEDMARFLGIFTGSMMIFTLLVKLLAFSYLIRNYGLKVCLAVSPVLIAILTAVAIMIGITMGYTREASSGFLIFFLILAMGRLFSKSLKDSIESPSFKVVYQTLDEKIRYEVQSSMDGTVNEISALSSGLILAGLGLLSFIKLIHFSFVLLIIILIWAAVAFMLYAEYRKSIRNALESKSPGIDTSDNGEAHHLKSRFSAEISFRSEYYGLVTGNLSTLESSPGQHYVEQVIRYASENNDHNLIPALQRISGLTGVDDKLRDSARQLAAHLVSTPGETSTRAGYARQLLAGSRVPHATELLRLLRDNSTDSKRYAILMIGKFRLNDMLTEVCGCLHNPLLQTDAENVLTSFGPSAVEELIRFYLATSGNLETGRTVIRILGRIHAGQSEEFLFTRLWSAFRPIREIAAKGLIASGFRPSEEERDKLNQLISDVAALMTWNLAARVSLHRHNNAGLLEVLDKDIARWRMFMFDLLSIAYDKGSVEKIRENLEKDTVESGNFALEMIDLVIDESVKAKIIALLDIVPDEEKLKNLWHFYPGEIPSYERVVEDIVNKDYNLLNIWTKASALRCLDEITTSNMAESASALLFSPESVIREEAARLIGRSDSKLYERVSGRIPESLRKKLDNIISGQTPSEELVYEKLSFLSGLLKGIPEDELLLLSERMVYARNLPSDSVLGEDCIIWSADRESSPYIVYTSGNGHVRKGGSYYLLPLGIVEEFGRKFPERSSEILSYIDRNEN